MNFMVSKPSAGLVIRAKAVELLAMRGARVVARVAVPITGNERSHLAQAIRQAVEVSGLKISKLAVAVPTRDVLLRFFVMPSLPKAEWETAIQFEARKYLPFKTETLVWDYHAMEVKEPQKLEVIFTGIPWEGFNEIRAALGEAGIQPTRMESRSVSLARLTASTGRYPATAPGDFVCLVDLEEGEAHLVIARAGVPYLTRDIPLPSEEPKALADPVVKASQAPDAAPGIQRLFTELRVSIGFFTREYPWATIAKVILVGREELAESCHQLLGEQLRCPVEIGREFLGAQGAGGLPLSFAAAAGLVRAKQGRDGAALDFLKRSLVKIGRGSPRPGTASASDWMAQLRSPQTVAIAGVAVGALMVLSLLGSRQVAMEQGRLTQLVQSRPDVGWGLNRMDLESLKPVHEQATRQVGLLKQLVDQRIGAAAKLDALARSLSEGMWLTDLIFEERPDHAGKTQMVLKVSGVCYLKQSAKELSAIQAFESRIKSNPALFDGFNAARIEQIREQVNQQGAQQYTYRTFELHCQSDRKL